MTIDVESETLLTFSQAARQIPGRPGISTIHRWWRRGVRGIKLATTLVGGRRYTSSEAIARFIAVAQGQPPLIRTPGQRQRAIGRAEQNLDRENI